jgi:CheY-like chemotaxis protein
MTPDVATQAFDPFFTTKGVGKGTGLGLSQVLGFIRQSGGHVKIYSEVGIGTSAKIYLPRHADGELRAAPRQDLPPLPGDPAITILVVEDDERVRAYSVEALRELGYSVLQAANGAEALDMLGVRDGVSLLFTDMVMPALHGRELAELARQMLPDLKVLYTTGYSRDAMAHRLVADAATQVLPKPFTIDQLAVSVRRALEA